METSNLYVEKVKILSRLVKESTLTLEEALLLLKEEKVVEEPVSSPSYIPGTVTPWIQPYVYGSSTTSPLTGTVTTNDKSGIYNLSNGTNNTTTVTLNTPTADLNN